MQSAMFWIGFTPLALVVGVGAFRLLVLLSISLPAFTKALVKLLKARDYERFPRLLRAAGESPASVVALRAYALRNQALTHHPGGDFVVGYRDRAPAGNFAASLRELIAPDLVEQRRRIRSRWILAAPGFLAPIWLWFTIPPSVVRPVIATMVIVLVSAHASYRARQFSRGLETMLDAILPLLDPRLE